MMPVSIKINPKYASFYSRISLKSGIGRGPASFYGSPYLKEIFKPNSRRANEATSQRNECDVF